MLRSSLAIAAMAVASLAPVDVFGQEWATTQPAVYYPARTHVQYSNVVTTTHTTRRVVVVHRNHPHRKTIKRVGIGAGAGAAAGALLGGGKGAGIGALVGGGAGAVYDHHEKSRGR